MPRAQLSLVLSVLVGLAGCAGNLMSDDDGGRPQGPGQAASTVRQSPVSTRAIPPEPELTEVQQQLVERARTAAASQAWDEAAQALEQLLQQRDDLPRLTARLAWVRQQQGRTGEATVLYHNAVAANPADALSINNLALLLREAGDFRQASEVLEQGLAYSPRVPELHFNLAVLSELYLLDLPRALDHYRQYQALLPTPEKRVEGWIADIERRVDES